LLRQFSLWGRFQLFCRLLAFLLFCLPGVLHGNVLEDSRRSLLANILTERNIPFETRPLFAGFGGFGSSLHVSLPASPEAGEQKSGVFILALPLSFTGDDRREFPYAFETALGFIDRVRGEGLPRDALVAFLGDEWSALQADQTAPHVGLRDLYSRLELPEDAALIYLDMCRETGALRIHHGARRILAPLNILAPLARLCGERRIPSVLAVRSSELYKLGLADGPSALEFALERELPALCLAGDAAGSLPDLDALLFDYARSVETGTENSDRHYLVFQIPGGFFFVSEYATALLFLAVAALFFFATLVYSVALRRRLALQWKIFFKRSWILLLYWLLLMLALKGTALIFRGILRGTDPALPEGNILWFYAAAACQLAAGFLLFAAFSFLGDYSYVPQRANFYGSSAVILVILEILLAACIDITFIPLFIRAFVFIFLAACVRKPVIVRLCALLSFFQGGGALLTLIRTGNRRLGSLIFSGDTAFIFYLALAALPVFITLKRGALLGARGTGGSPRKPGQAAKPAVLLRRMAPRLVLFVSMAALGAGAWFFARGPAVPAEAISVVDEPESGSFLFLEVRENVFLERRILSITLQAPLDPLRFNLYVDGIQGGETPLIYSAPMPFRYLEESPDRSSVEFVLGEGPPNPFVTEIALPVDFAGLLRAEALYAEGGDQSRIIRRYPVGPADGDQ
jgi:hypothetical protein